MNFNGPPKLPELPLGVTALKGTHRSNHNITFFHKEGSCIGYLELYGDGSFDVSGFDEEPEILEIALDYVRREKGVGPYVDIYEPTDDNGGMHWYAHCVWSDEDSDNHFVIGIGRTKEDAINVALRDIQKIIDRLNICKTQLLSKL